MDPGLIHKLWDIADPVASCVRNHRLSVAGSISGPTRSGTHRPTTSHLGTTPPPTANSLHTKQGPEMPTRLYTVVSLPKQKGLYSTHSTLREYSSGDQKECTARTQSTSLTEGLVIQAWRTKNNYKNNPETINKTIDRSTYLSMIHSYEKAFKFN